MKMNMKGDVMGEGKWKTLNGIKTVMEEETEVTRNSLWSMAGDRDYSEDGREAATHHRRSIWTSPSLEWRRRNDGDSHQIQRIISEPPNCESFTYTQEKVVQEDFLHTSQPIWLCTAFLGWFKQHKRNTEKTSFGACKMAWWWNTSYINRRTSIWRNSTHIKSWGWCVVTHLQTHFLGGRDKSSWSELAKWNSWNNKLLWQTARHPASAKEGINNKDTWC